MKKSILFSTFLILGISCSNQFLEEDTNNTPQENFNILWEDFDKHYGLFSVRNHNWDSIYNAHSSLISSQTSDEELWDNFKEIIEYLDDSHVFIYDPFNDIEFYSGSEEDDQVEEEFSLSLIKNSYLEYHENILPNVLIGKLKNKNIGYLYLNDFEIENTNFMNQVILKSQDYSALIIDIRNNTGGIDEIGQEIAGRFADEERFLYSVQTRNGDNHDDFTSKTNYYSKVIGEQQFTNPVIVLTDKITVSTAEVFLTYMKSFPNVTQIGDTTAGDFSGVSMRRFLPNGWQYQYSIMMFLLPDGSSLDGIGHKPDIFVRNTVGDISSNIDKVIENSITYLYDAHNIN